MSKTKRNRYPVEFKAKAALEAIKGEQAVSELGSRYRLHPNMITNWKQQSRTDCCWVSQGKYSMEDMYVIHEDPEFVVVVKPSGLLSVPGRGPENLDCVSERVKARYPGCIEQPAVHRLDMDTSGLLVVARTKEVHRNLSIQFQEGEVTKRYIAILDGELDGEEGVVELPFRLDIDNRPYQIYDPVHGKVGITHWKKLLVKDGKTRIEFKPVTGRTHQLRVHSASEHGLGIPIVGDPLYGTGTGPGLLKLHACYLSFAHPRTGERLEFTSGPLF